MLPFIKKKLSNIFLNIYISNHTSYQYQKQIWMLGRLSNN